MSFIRKLESEFEQFIATEEEFNTKDIFYWQAKFEETNGQLFLEFWE